jgi:hypothetical protein
MLPAKKKTVPTTVETAFDRLYGWSPHGCTATVKEATPFLKSFSDDQLVELYGMASEHYEQTADTRFSSVLESHGVDEDGELYPNQDEDAVSAIEDLHDALKVRWLVSVVHSQRLEKAKLLRVAGGHGYPTKTTAAKPRVGKLLVPATGNVKGAWPKTFRVV